MTITVQISDFRKDMSSYINQMIDSQGIINLKRGKTVVAKMIPQVSFKKRKVDWDGFWSDLEKIWAMQPKTGKKTDYSMRIDEILYGKK